MKILMPLTPLTVEPIGVVRSPRQEIRDDGWGAVEAAIELDGARFPVAALAGLQDFSHIEVLYYFHLVDPANIGTASRRPRNRAEWPEVGIFAQRGKNRPNRLGLCTCEILAVEDHTLHVRGLDALDGSPVLDLKPVMREFLPHGEIRQPAWATEIMSNYFSTSM